MSMINAVTSWCGGSGLWSGGGPGWFGGMGFHFGGIFQLLIIGLIIYFTVRLFRNETSPTPNTGTGGPAPDSPSAEDIVKQRYASGEIDKDTFHDMMKQLR